MKQWLTAFWPSQLSWRCLQTARIARQAVPSLVEYVPRQAHLTEFPECRVSIETCGNVYKKWRIEKRFWAIPEGNLTFDVKYVDTHHERKRTDESAVNDVPVVLALHGAPGTYKDFGLLTSYLFQQGLRVIAPNFPDYSCYPPGVFRFSLEEKTQFVKDFLEAINVPQIDMLICHSSSFYPGLQLCVDNKKPYVASLALLNPGSYSTDLGTIMPFALLQAIVFLGETDLGLKFLKLIGPSVLSRTPLRVDQHLDPLLSATTMVYGNIPKVRKHLHELSIRQFPVFLAFSEDDKMVRKELSYRLAYKLGPQDLDITYFAADGTISREGRMVRNVKALVFERGSHYAHWKHPEIINSAIHSFLVSNVL